MPARQATSTGGRILRLPRGNLARLGAALMLYLALATPAFAQVMTFNGTSPSFYTGPGQVITFTLSFGQSNAVTNSITLENMNHPVSNFSCAGLPLAPNATTTCTGTYTTTASDTFGIAQFGQFRAISNGVARGGNISNRIVVPFGSDPPAANVFATVPAVDEDGGNVLRFQVGLNKLSSVPLTVNYTTGGTATAGSDYAPVSGSVTLPLGAINWEVTVDPTADSAPEPDETVVVGIAPGTGYTVGSPSSATGTIRNDDTVSLTVDDVTVAEIDAGVSHAVFTVSLDAPAGAGGVSFDITTADGTAIAGSDYDASSLSGLTIPAGASSHAFSVSVIGDALNEPTETFFVNVANVTGATVADGQGVGTIVDNDPLPSLSLGDAEQVEGNSGTTGMVFTVTLSAPSGQAVTVDYATADGTAAAPGDYAPSSGSLVFAPGTTSRTIPISVAGDTAAEADETFTVGLSGATNATIADASGTGTIVNDDVPITIDPSGLPGAAVGAAYSQALAASGGSAPYDFTVTAGALPAGVSMSSGGVLSGTPTASGTFDFTVTATDGSAPPGPHSGSRAYTLVVAAASITVSPATLPSGTSGVAYDQALSAGGGTAPYAFAVTAGALPAGLSLSPAGVLSGTPTASGTFGFTATATDSSTGGGPFSGSRAYSLTIANAVPVANDGSADVAYGAPALLALDITGVVGSVAVASAPSHGATSVSGTSITYTPATGYAGPDSFTYTASNDGGTSAPATVSITVGDPVIAVAAAGGFDATAGVPYSQTFTWSGGAAPYGGYQIAGLPAGLSVTATTADSVTVSGTPTVAGAFGLDASATDSSTGNGPFTGHQAFTLAVAAPTLALAPGATTFGAPYNAAYSQAFTASGGVGPYAYALAGALPAGLSFSDGTLSGAPAAPGSYPITVTATDTGSTGAGAPFTVSAPYTLVVAAPTIVLEPATLAGGTAGQAYEVGVAATGGAAPYGFAITAGTLPTGLSLAADGRLSGTPTAAGTFDLTITATDANGQSGSRGYALAVAVPALSLTPATLAAAVAGTPYGQSLTASGGIAPYTLALTGTLPAGVTFDAAAGALAGTPAESGTFDLSVTVTDATAGTAATLTRDYTLTVQAPTLSMTPAAGALPGGTAGVGHMQAFAAEGGIAPYVYTLASGTLPAGLSLAADGTLSGTPTEAGAFDFSVTATDSTGGSAATVAQAYTLAIDAPAITVDPATLPAAIFGMDYAATLQANGGTAPYAFTVTAGALPAGLSLSADGDLSGAPTESGEFVLEITATDALGFAGARSYTLQAIDRPDPSQDAEVRGLLDAQVQSARRFARAQVDNFQQRLERLHGGRRDNGVDNRLGLAAHRTCTQPPGSNPPDRPDRCERPMPAADGMAPAAGDPADGDAGMRRGFGAWIGGSLRSGSFDGQGGSSAGFETDGVSLGVDFDLGPAFTLGAGLGYGRDDNDVGDAGSRMESSARALVGYASYHPGGHLFVDALAGYQTLDFDLHRQLTAADGMVRGRRDGDQWFGSLSLGADLQRGSMQFTPYARFDITRASLDAYTETGHAFLALRYEAMDVDSSTGNLGLRMDYRHRIAPGWLTPQLRIEYQRELEGNGDALVRYADLAEGPWHTLTPSAFDRSRFMLGLGASFEGDGGWTTRFEYRAEAGGDDQRDEGVLINVQKDY
ncbi:putative Ig domain-containing protein [Luteimonas sp. R10]|uniref:putative Ig domain-containing protein n=1 Tax=Luteimonas sp. R10 TaxID=3108176 RepID=UPI00308DDAAC|nr:putative Ig domain-containing protein [Luteimonas sp. R10]